jgi:hypothetical protein
MLASVIASMKDTAGLVMNLTISLISNPKVIRNRYILANLFPAFTFASINSLALSVAALRT